jgi:O-antigen synthesis protein wbyH
MNNILIIGAGIAGLGASYALRGKGYSPIILEKDDTYGGLAGNFTVAGGFRFDRFVHFSFTNNEKVNDIFNKSTEGNIIRHTPNPFNVYKGKWIKHPAQNNLYPLSKEEKDKIIEDFKSRPNNVDVTAIHDYEQWLRIQYGNTFAEHFPMAYTPKYWMCEASELETKWVGNRLYQPSIDEVVEGANSAETPVTYYAKEMRYPTKGGFKQYLSELAKDADIRYNSEVVEIDVKNHTLKTANGKEYQYSRLVSSMPLPLLISRLKNEVPEDVRKAARLLKCTSGYQISIALKGKNIPPYLWWYIYDKDILPARVYSPSLKSPDNVPEGCSSLQLEVYCEKDVYSRDELIEKSVKPLIKLGAIREEDIIEIDVRFEPWANIVFDHNIYEVRKIVIDYIRSVGIEPIGRFGLWDYLWTDQALLSGLDIE